MKYLVIHVSRVRVLRVHQTQAIKGGETNVGVGKRDSAPPAHSGGAKNGVLGVISTANCRALGVVMVCLLCVL